MSFTFGLRKIVRSRAVKWLNLEGVYPNFSFSFENQFFKVNVRYCIVRTFHFETGEAERKKTDLFEVE